VAAVARSTRGFLYIQKKDHVMRKTLVVLAALALSAALPAAAQKPDVTGGTAVMSEPG
jgi:hypothetical protein